MNRQGGVELAAGSPLGTAAAMTSQSLHASQPLSFDVAVIGGSATGVFAAVRAAEKGMKAAPTFRAFRVARIALQAQARRRGALPRNAGVEDHGLSVLFEEAVEGRSERMNTCSLRWDRTILAVFSKHRGDRAT